MPLLSRNTKIKKTGKKTGKRVFNWSLPAVFTCPNAGACKVGCYATMGAYRFSNVAKAIEAKYKASQELSFIDDMVDEIQRVKADVVRIHDSGDFYNKLYAMKWCAIAASLPTVKFYAYTKMVSMMKELQQDKMFPNNLIIIYSFGGKEDKLINPSTDRHSRVFPNMESLLDAGYVNAMENDLVACNPENLKIGLAYHGNLGYNKTNWMKVKG